MTCRKHPHASTACGGCMVDATRLARERKAKLDRGTWRETPGHTARVVVLPDEAWETLDHYLGAVGGVQGYLRDLAKRAKEVKR